MKQSQNPQNLRAQQEETRDLFGALVATITPPASPATQTLGQSSSTNTISTVSSSASLTTDLPIVPGHFSR